MVRNQSIMLTSFDRSGDLLACILAGITSFWIQWKPKNNLAPAIPKSRAPTSVRASFRRDNKHYENKIAQQARGIFMLITLRFACPEEGVDMALEAAGTASTTFPTTARAPSVSSGFLRSLFNDQSMRNRLLRDKIHPYGGGRLLACTKSSPCEAIPITTNNL